jgi:hypothetical protein
MPKSTFPVQQCSATPAERVRDSTYNGVRGATRQVCVRGPYRRASSMCGEAHCREPGFAIAAEFLRDRPGNTKRGKVYAKTSGESCFQWLTKKRFKTYVDTQQERAAFAELTLHQRDTIMPSSLAYSFRRIVKPGLMGYAEPFRRHPGKTTDTLVRILRSLQGVLRPGLAMAADHVTPRAQLRPRDSSQPRSVCCSPSRHTRLRSCPWTCKG